ncbi:hypothetical protein DFR90_005328 [Clostridium beijerinckii]|nr:hypothetical protein [Clostridium beijerinckii]
MKASAPACNSTCLALAAALSSVALALAAASAFFCIS